MYCDAYSSTVHCAVQPNLELAIYTFCELHYFIKRYLPLTQNMNIQSLHILIICKIWFRIHKIHKKYDRLFQLLFHLYVSPPDLPEIFVDKSKRVFHLIWYAISICHTVCTQKVQNRTAIFTFWQYFWYL